MPRFAKLALRNAAYCGILAYGPTARAFIAFPFLDMLIGAWWHAQKHLKKGHTLPFMQQLTRN
jgi:hypothetical protein